MGMTVENMLKSTLVFETGKGGKFALKEHGKKGSTAWLNDEQAQHATVLMLLQRKALRKVTLKQSEKIESEAKAAQKPREAIEFEKAVEEVVDVAEVNTPDLRIMNPDGKNESDREAEQEEPAEEQPEPEMVKVQCSAITGSGNRCRNSVVLTAEELEAQGGEAFCKRHSKEQ